MAYYDELNNRLEKIRMKNEELSKRIELLSLDASSAAKNRIEKLISEKIENKVLELYGSKENTEFELYTTYINKIEKNIKDEELSTDIRYSFIDRLKQRIILYILRYVDDDYLYDKLWNKLIK